MSLRKYVRQLNPVQENYIAPEVKVQSLLSEAYSFFPKSEKEISNTLKDFPHESVKDIINLFNFLKVKDKTPINIDLNKPKDVNVSRTLKGVYDISDIKGGADLKTIRIKFGNGSSGNRGANNRGNAFETTFANAIEKWYAEGDDAVDNKQILDAIRDLDKTYNLGKSKTFDAKVVGGVNTKRPLDFGGRIKITNTKSKGFDIGESVTDITLLTDNNPPIFLSLKLGGTTTFFNVGVKTKITKDEIDSGIIKNKDGKKLLELFGIDNKRFCTLFNDKVKSKSGVVNGRPDVAGLNYLLQSGIGFGYHVIHQVSGKIISKVMDASAMKKAAKVGKVKIFYGGKGGKGKRVDVVMESDSYIFGVNIRDTQGGDGYPTRMMCDFKNK